MSNFMPRRQVRCFGLPILSTCWCVIAEIYDGRGEAHTDAARGSYEPAVSLLGVGILYAAKVVRKMRTAPVRSCLEFIFAENE